MILDGAREIKFHIVDAFSVCVNVNFFVGAWSGWKTKWEQYWEMREKNGIEQRTKSNWVSFSKFENSIVFPYTCVCVCVFGENSVKIKILLSQRLNCEHTFLPFVWSRHRILLFPDRLCTMCMLLMNSKGRLVGVRLDERQSTHESIFNNAVN